MAMNLLVKFGVLLTHITASGVMAMFFPYIPQGSSRHWTRERVVWKEVI